MIEGLWVIKFLTPDDPTMALNGGVVVVETGRIFGGDSGYFYVGSLDPAGKGTWNANVRITRHDPDIESVFGDVDMIELSGSLTHNGEDPSHRPLVRVLLAPTDQSLQMTAIMIRVADLP